MYIYKYTHICLIIYIHTHFFKQERLTGGFPHFLGGFGACFSPICTSAMSTNKWRSPVTPSCLHCPSHSQMWKVCLDSTSSSSYYQNPFERNSPPRWRESTVLNTNPVTAAQCKLSGKPVSHSDGFHGERSVATKTTFPLPV